jgi:inorganic pyrophosphatase
MNFHEWHDVPVGDGQPHVVNSIVEISKGSRAKYELDKATGLLRLDRVLYSSVYYPANYGFIPRTLGEDGDPLDILVFSQVAVEPLCLVYSKVIGVMRMIDGGLADDKVIAVAATDVSVNYFDEITSLPEYLHREMKHFFEEYTVLENKIVHRRRFPADGDRPHRDPRGGRALRRSLRTSRTGNLVSASYIDRFWNRRH